MSSSEQNTGLKLLKNTLWILQVITLIYSAINLAESSSDYVRSTNLDTLWSSKSLNKVEKCFIYLMSFISDIVIELRVNDIKNFSYNLFFHIIVERNLLLIILDFILIISLIVGIIGILKEKLCAIVFFGTTMTIVGILFLYFYYSRIELRDYRFGILLLINGLMTCLHCFLTPRKENFANIQKY
jgi:hypothetical protein